jgi:peptidoglycan/LPS O-acetylase OafA/YrhL
MTPGPTIVFGKGLMQNGIMGYKSLIRNSDEKSLGNSENQRNSWLDVIRGLAIFSVVSTHSITRTDAFIAQSVQSSTFSFLVGLGKYGVELFFFLSGWLLASIYGLSGNKVGKDYWVRRIARIYPLWIIFLVINIVRSVLTKTGGIYYALNTQESNFYAIHSYGAIIFLTLTFTLFISGGLWNSVIAGGWSIQAEVAHYLIFPILRNRSMASILRILTLLNVLTALLAITRPKLDNFPKFSLQLIDAWLRLSLYSTLAYFVIGAFTFMLYRKLKEAKSLKSQIDYEIPWISALLFLPSILIIPCPFGQQIEAIGYLAIVFLVSFCILNNSVLNLFFQKLGRYSYFIYFMHFFVLDAVTYFLSKINFIGKGIGSQQLLFCAILSTALGVSILAASPSMKYFERPILKFAHRVK